MKRIEKFVRERRFMNLMKMEKFSVCEIFILKMFHNHVSRKKNTNMKEREKHKKKLREREKCVRERKEKSFSLFFCVYEKKGKEKSQNEKSMRREFLRGNLPTALVFFTNDI